MYDFDGNLFRIRIHEFGDKGEYSRTINVMNIMKKIINDDNSTDKVER